MEPTVDDEGSLDPEGCWKVALTTCRNVHTEELLCDIRFCALHMINY